MGGQRTGVIQRMEDLITNKTFVRQTLRKVDDLPGVRHDLDKAVRYAARDIDPAGAVSFTRAALALVDFTAAQLRPLLEDEARRWNQRLRWDYTRSIELLLEYLDTRVPPGFAALPGGRVRGSAFCVYAASKAVVGAV